MMTALTSMIAASACAPVAPSIDKSKFLSSKQAPAQTPDAQPAAPAPAKENAEKKQVIVRVSGSQFELRKSWLSSKAAASALKKLEKSDAVVIELQEKDGTLDQLLAEGVEFTSAKINVRKVHLLFVSRDLKDQ